MMPKNLEEAVKSSWGKDTCYPPSAEKWSSENSALGQCAVTALVVNDYLGGEILNCKSLHHYYNLLQDHTIVDLTKSQFPEGTLINSDRFVLRENLLYGESAEKANTLNRYYILRKRVSDKLACSQPTPIFNF
ncbi:MAG: hypothetical protein AABX93_02515 [Nanoarchaeota archaeon]